MDKKLEVYLRGGLGNQLYQYSSARYIQEKWGFDKIKIITKSYDHYKIRNLELTNFLLVKGLTYENRIGFVDKLVIGFYHVFQKLYSIFTKRRPPVLTLKLISKQYYCAMAKMDNVNITNQYDTLLYSYLVSAKAATKMKNDLMNEIRLKGKKSNAFYDYLELIQSGISVAISIRCDEDYVKNGWPICQKEFYISGLNKILNSVGMANVFVFADKIEIVKQEKWFEGFNVYYVEGVDVCETFELLRHCNNYVLSNSSFSWWGGFLSYSSNPIKYSSNRVFEHEYEDDITFYTGITLLDYITGEEVRKI